MSKVPEQRVLMGAITRAHGIRGQVVVKWFGDDIDAIRQYGTFEDETGERSFRVLKVKPHKDDTVLAQLDGIDSRDAAEALRGTPLYVKRSALGPTGDDEFYLVDLVGLDVVDEDGATVGTVSAMHNFGAGNVVEIAPASGGDTLMLPFTSAFVPEVVPGERIVVALPEESDE